MVRVQEALRTVKQQAAEAEARHRAELAAERARASQAQLGVRRAGGRAGTPGSVSRFFFLTTPCCQWLVNASACIV